MDVASFIVVLLVETTDLADPSTRAMTRTVQESLEGRAVVVVRDAAREGLSDPNATALGARLRADAIVVVTWSPNDHGRALVHVFRAGDPRWVDRELAFRAEDPPSERGRMLGFEIASMVPEVAEPARAAPAPPPAESPPPPAPANRRPVLALDAAFAVATGLGGPAGGFGGESSARVWLTDSVAVRGGAGLRAGSVPSANASTTVTRLVAGVVARVHETTGERPVSVATRLDLLVLHHAVSSDSDGSSGARWVPGLGLAGELVWRVTRPVGVVAAVGVEVAGGTTRVFLGDRAVDTIPAFRATAELGLRVLLF
jgi:hypothetical protein